MTTNETAQRTNNPSVSVQHVRQLRCRNEGLYIGSWLGIREGEAARRWSMLLCMVACSTVVLVVDDEVDVALAPELRILRTVLCDMHKAEHFEYRLELTGFGGGEFNELETIETHGVVNL